MKLLLISQFHPPEMEPSGFMFSSLAEHLTLNKNNDVHLISGFTNFPAGKFTNWNFLKVFYGQYFNGYKNHQVLVYPSSNKNNINRVINYLSFMIFSFIRGLFIWNVNKIVVTSPPIFSAISALLLSKIKRVPYIIDIRDIWPESAVQMGNLKNPAVIKFFSWIEKILYKNAESIVVATPGMVNDISSKLDDFNLSSTKKITFIPCGIKVYSKNEINGYRDSNSILDNFKNDFTVIYAGLHGLAQNLFSILDTAKLLIDEKEIKFLFFGDGPSKSDLMKYAMQNNLKNVSFFDPVNRDEIRSIYSKGSCAIVPLRDLDIFKTVFPSKTFELLSFKLPIIVGVGGQLSSLLNSEDAALCVKPDDSEQYADAIMSLYECKDTYERISTNGRNLAKKMFDYKITNKKFKEIIES